MRALFSTFDFGDSRLGDTGRRGQVPLGQTTVSPQLTKDCACFSSSVHRDMIPYSRSKWVDPPNPDGQRLEVPQANSSGKLHGLPRSDP